MLEKDVDGDKHENFFVSKETRPYASVLVILAPRGGK